MSSAEKTIGLSEPTHEVGSQARLPAADATADSQTVLFLVSHSSAGGAQEIWVNLAAGFRNRGARVALLALYPMPRSTRETPADLPWEYIVPERPTGPIGMARMLRALVARIRRDRPDAIVTAMPAANILAALAARLAGRRDIVVTSHHSPAETHNPKLNAIDAISGGLRSVRAIVGVSQTVTDSLDGKPNRYRAKRRTIHNALPPEIEALLADLAARRADRPGGGRRVVATGRLAYQKNYPLLIRAAAHLPDVSFDIVGDGPDRDTLEALVRELGVGDRVRFLGHQPRRDALEVLARGDVFVQVSHFEGHSLALIEAAKLGLPLIVSDVPVQIEGITTPGGERCGIAVATDDDLGLARAIRTLLDDPQAMQRASQAARTLASHATFDAMVDSYRELVR